MMFLIIKIDNVIATLYRNGWDISSSKVLVDGKNNLIGLLKAIMDEPLQEYAPNYYYSKGKKIESVIKNAKMLYYLGQYDERDIPENTVY